MTDNIKAAKNIIICAIRDMVENGNMEAASDLYMVQSNDLDVIYLHVKAISNIFNNAKKDLEKELKKNV